MQCLLWVFSRMDAGRVRRSILMLRKTMIVLLTMALGRGFAGLHAEARGHFDRDHFHRGRRFFGFGGGYDDWCSEYPYYTQNCYLYGY
jgi:hypothetical protein